MTTQVQPQEGPQSQPREAETPILVTEHPSAVMFGYIKWNTFVAQQTNQSFIII